MFAICIEASHAKGMGHLFRMLNFARYLEKKSQEFIFLINDNKKTKEILISNVYKYEIVNLEDMTNDWETNLIRKYNFIYWINDRLNTNVIHAQKVIKNKIKLITFDDLGSGARLCDINICGLFFNNDNIKGKKVLKGVNYLILNSEIDQFKKNRTKLRKIFVSLGGSDTYGVTVNVLKLLKKYHIKATLHIGPSFNHQEELNKELTDDFNVVHFIPSLIEEFAKYDLAITGGGITPFEANASGLPCMIIANEVFEVPNGEFLSSIGSSVFLGFHKNIDENIFKSLYKLDIKRMSQNGLSQLSTEAVKKIFKEIMI